MASKEINLDQDITPDEVAFVLGVSTRTVTNWLRDGKLAAHQDFNRRRRIPVRELFRLAEEMGMVGQPAELLMRERLREDIMPKYAGGRAQSSSKNVLSTV